MTLAIRGDLKPRLRLRARDLARGTSIERLILARLSLCQLTTRL